jgi:hypothetical protein
MDQQQLKIWFAGFYEGEGCISNDIHNRNRLKISIAQNDRTPLDIGQKIWGGYVRERIRKSSASDKICKGQFHKCVHCEKLYSSLDSMKRHIKINHSSVASICDEQMQHTL